ncbi:MAG: T9SS type A sorting domain-containing protein [Flavobacteriales bacterium]|jgi:hypothetical protein|nr:T9SS type A sorting domain-containing protein [Flavobacteriales bacterium]
MKTALTHTGLLCAFAMQAQPGWQQFFMPTTDLACVVRDLVEHPSGDVYAVLLESNPDGTTGSRLVHLLDDGEPIGNVALQGERVIGMDLHVHPSGDLWTVAVSGQVGAESGIELIRHGPNLALLGTTKAMYDPQYRPYSLQACMDGDGFLTVAFNRLNLDAWGDQAFHALQFNPQGDSIRSALLREYYAYGHVNSMTTHPSGGFVLNSSGSFWGDTASVVSAAYLTYLNDTLGIMGSLPLPHVDPSEWNPHNSPHTPSQTHCLANGEMLVSGRYWPDISDFRGSVLQHLDSTAQVLRQWVNNGPEFFDLPGDNSTFDLTPDGHIYIAQTENAFWQGVLYPWWEWPTRIRLFKLNGEFEQVGEYLVDGFVDDTYYFLYGVKGAADGGVFLYGSVCSTLPGSHPRAWVRKFGPDELVGVPEVDRSHMRLYPNPGSAGFQVMLKEPVANAVLTLLNAHGQVCASLPVNGLGAVVDTGQLAVGLYFVRLHDRLGYVLHTARWVKE